MHRIELSRRLSGNISPSHRTRDSFAYFTTRYWHRHCFGWSSKVLFRAIEGDPKVDWFIKTSSNWKWIWLDSYSLCRCRWVDSRIYSLIIPCFEIRDGLKLLTRFYWVISVSYRLKRVSMTPYTQKTLQICKGLKTTSNLSLVVGCYVHLPSLSQQSIDGGGP